MVIVDGIIVFCDSNEIDDIVFGVILMLIGMIDMLVEVFIGCDMEFVYGLFEGFVVELNSMI